MITTSSERESRQILTSIKNGTTTFEEAARTNSRDWAADRGGDMGEWMAANLTFVIGNDQARESVLTLAKGELTDVYKQLTGWSFYRIDEAAYPIDMGNLNHERDARQYVMQNERGQIEDWAFKEAEKFIERANEIGFEEAITADNITRRRLGPISLNYGNAALFGSLASFGVHEVGTSGNDPFFWRAAFNTPINSLSRPFVAGDFVIVLRPVEETNLDETEIGYIEAYYPYWIRSNSEEVFRSYFLNNEKLDDRFQETFSKIWGES